MKHIKKFESFKTNETMDMMFMPVDPLSKVNDVYSDIIDSIVNKYKEYKDKKELLSFAVVKMEKMIKAGDYPNKIYNSLTNEPIDADITHLISDNGKQYWGPTSGMLSNLPPHEIFNLMRKAAYNCREDEAYINLIDRVEKQVG
jgi:hypothetical protein